MMPYLDLHPRNIAKNAFAGNVVIRKLQICITAITWGEGCVFVCVCVRERERERVSVCARMDLLE